MYQYIKDKRFEIVSSVFNCIYSDFCEELGGRGGGGGGGGGGGIIMPEVLT